MNKPTLNTIFDTAILIEGCGEGYLQTIDKDQCVNENDHANYSNYRLTLDMEDARGNKLNYRYSSKEMENFFHNL